MSKSLAKRLAEARQLLADEGVTVDSKEWLADIGRDEGVGLWTNGKATIVLPLVTSACWCIENDDDDNSIDLTAMENATMLEITCGSDVISLSDENFKNDGVSFLRALSLYWETRS